MQCYNILESEEEEFDHDKDQNEENNEDIKAETIM